MVMKSIILSIVLFLYLDGVAHSGIVVIPVDPDRTTKDNKSKYQSYTGGSPLEIWREKQKVKKNKMDQRQNVRPDVAPLEINPHSIKSRRPKFWINFRINN
jgi:hypothetical protein